MEQIKAKCSSIVQADNRGTVLFNVISNDKKVVNKVEIQIAISYNNPKAVANYEHGKEYTFDIKPSK